MPTITIPKKFTKGEELVIISRKEYDQFLRSRKIGKASVTAEDAIAEGLRDLRAGRVTPSFSSVKEFKGFLKRK